MVKWMYSVVDIGEGRGDGAVLPWLYVFGNR